MTLDVEMNDKQHAADSPEKAETEASDKKRLVHVSHETLERKDFRVEVRGLRDISTLLEKCSVMLDVTDQNDKNHPEARSSLECLIDKMLGSMSMAMYNAGERVTKEEIKSIIFASEERDIFSRTLQGCDDSGQLEQSWLVSTNEVPSLSSRVVGLARMAENTNMGEGAHEVKFFILILCPSNIKGTKTALETGRTFATLLSDMDLRRDLQQSENETELKAILSKGADRIAEQSEPSKSNLLEKQEEEKTDKGSKWVPFRGIRDDLAKRLPFYWSDYKDGIIGNKAFSKTLSTTFFLYFSIILPAIAFGNLQDTNTEGAINVEKVLIGQVLGGLIFSIFSGQPLVVVMTTAPLVLFTKIIDLVAADFGYAFLPFFAMVGIWNSFFLIIYAVFNLSILMKFSSRATEETFGNFISIALTVDAMKHLAKSFVTNYDNEVCDAFDRAPGEHERHAQHTESSVAGPLLSAMAHNITKRAAVDSEEFVCQKEVPLLYLILMLGTVWLGLTLFDFVKTPFLSPRKRELLSDYSLPVAVVVFSIIGSVGFWRVPLDKFRLDGDYKMELVAFGELKTGGYFFSALLGFSLSILFFMDQNISAAMVNSPENHLKKGNAYHWDLVVVAIINLITSIFGLPFMHAVLPHSPLHVQCLADKETRVTNGYAQDVVTHVRETRLTNLFSNILIGVTLTFLHYILPYIPKAVLDGLFLYMAVTALYGNQMFERFLLFFTEQAAYPPNHYIKRVPQRKIHLFTCLQLVDLAILCVFGFMPWPYIKMIFPIVLALFLPIRHKIFPRFIEEKYLKHIDPTTTD